MNEDFIKDHKFFIAHVGFFTIFIMLAGTSSQSERVSKV